MMKHLQAILCCGLLLLGAALPLSAQFFTLGADPGGVRWSSVETPTYRLVYPRGLDSLARAYALELERTAVPVGATLGVTPNAAYRNKMPVILHPFTAYSNGQVTWTPRRMDLLTTPDADGGEATPWTTQLAVHESRHVAQMQPGAMKPFRWLNVLTGQLVPGGLAAVYAGPALFEGEAVVAETALTASGRGRTADFLEYYRVSFAAGDFRDFYRWRYGSQRWYTPDYYRAGYLAVAGVRAQYGVPDLGARFYQRIADHGGVAFFNWNKTVREATGKPFKEAFSEISSSLQDFWAADEAARGPFTPSEPVSAVPRRFTEYTDLEEVDDDLFALQEGITQPQRLIRITPDGQEHPVTLTGTSISGPMFCEATGKLYWSEVVRDARWPLRSYSIIRYYDGTRVRSLTRRTRYYNPYPSPEKAELAVTEYREDGSACVAVLDAKDGSVLRSWPAPSGLQPVETVWVGDDVYVDAITAEGYGLYRLPDYTCVLSPRPVKIQQLWDDEDRLMFTCDLTGVNELYSLNPASGEAPLRLTTTRFGASNFNELRDTLFYSVLQPEGRLLRKTAMADLKPEPADFSVLPTYPFAEELAAGEPLAIDRLAEVEVSDPQPYSKLAHLFRFHSWAPFYVAFDSLDDLSLATVTEKAGLGATAFFQNDLGTSSGFVGYHLGREDGVWRHSGHVQFNYTGLYPVIEFSADLGERDAYNYFLEKNEEKRTISLKHNPRGVPSLSGSLRAYIPWNFSSGGWLRGLVPTATLLFNNDYFNGEALMHRTTLSLRAYAMQHTPDSRVYPRFGIGAELGYSFRFVSGLLAPSGYAYLYGYLPGLHETHGIRWSVLGSKRFDGMFSETYANAAPRGFKTAVSRYLATYPTQFKGAVDYKLPLIPVDRAVLGPVAYLRNFELTLHGDYAAFFSTKDNGALFSAGADLEAVLGNFFWIPYTTRIGVSYNYNGGPSYAAFAAEELPVQRHVFSLIFSVDM